MTVPLLPSTIQRPPRAGSEATSTPVTAGIPRLRARMAAWLATPPLPVTMAASRAWSTLAASEGSSSRVTRMTRSSPSPSSTSWRRPASTRSSRRPMSRRSAPGSRSAPWLTAARRCCHSATSSRTATSAFTRFSRMRSRSPWRKDSSSSSRPCIEKMRASRAPTWASMRFSSSASCRRASSMASRRRSCSAATSASVSASTGTSTSCSVWKTAMPTASPGAMGSPATTSLPAGLLRRVLTGRSRGQALGDPGRQVRGAHALLGHAVAVAHGDAARRQRLAVDRDAEGRAHLVLPAVAAPDGARLVVEGGDAAPAQLVLELQRQLRHALLLHQREDGHLHRREARMQVQHGAHVVLALLSAFLGNALQLLLLEGLAQEGQQRAVHARGRLDDPGPEALARLAVEVLQLLAGGLAVA